MTASAGPDREFVARRGLVPTPAAPQAPPAAVPRAGGPGAFDELFRSHRDRLWAVALRTLGNPSDAEDAVQETFVAALRGGYRGDAEVGTWLHRILMNKCIDRLRRAERDRATGPGRTTVHDPTGAVATRLVLGAALALLAPEQRAAIVLVDVHGYAVAEAARILDVPRGTVKSRCARARLRLAELLGHLPEGP